MVLVTFSMDAFLQSKEFLENANALSFSVYCTIKNDYKKLSFVNTIESFCQKY